jgi:hypothetical protein
VALRSLLFVNLVGGGVGAAALARELGLGTAAVLAGTLAFVLSGTTIGLTVWTPTIQGEYVWMPLVLFLCERLVRAGRLRDGLWLGLVLAMAWLPGHPQFTLLSVELACLRLLWSLGDGSERRHIRSAVAVVAVALLLMLLLTAVQTLPATEVAAESVRGASGPQLSPGSRLSWHDLALAVRLHTVHVPFSVVPGFVVAAALANRRHRRAAPPVLYTRRGALPPPRFRRRHSTRTALRRHPARRGISACLSGSRTSRGSVSPC